MNNRNFKPMLILLFALTFFSCSSDDSERCDAVSCQNGGTSVDCGCDCQPGFTGADCAQQIAPESIEISQVKVRLFPALDSNGEDWDVGVGNETRPDIYFKLIISQTEVLYDSPVFYEDADVANEYSFTLDTPITVTDFSQPYIIALFDYDTVGEDESMAEDAFFIYQENNGFPEVISILDSEQPIAVDLEVNYNF